MSLNKIVNEVLETLYEGYITHHGTPIFDVTDIIVSHEENPVDVIKHMVDRGWVKNQEYRPTTVHASITMAGIQKIKPEYINDNVSKVISTLGINGNGWSGIMEILDFQPADFQRAHDLAKLLESNGLIETQFHYDDVIVKLSVTGSEVYEREKPDFA